MRLQLLSDLHLETESFDPQPLPGAELLILGGDIDATWQGLERFAGWPVPVLMVAGNHEFDGRELVQAWPALRERCAGLGIRLIERERVIVTSAAGARVRIVGTVRWSDFDGLGTVHRERAMRAAGYFMRLMGATRGGVALDAAGLRDEALACRRWLEAELAEPAQGRWQATVVVTHFAPSARCVDPRFGRQPSSASFVNADDDLLPRADLWLHGHVHCRHDFTVPRAGQRPTRVVCQAMGLIRKGEAEGFDPIKPIELDLPPGPLFAVDRAQAAAGPACHTGQTESLPPSMEPAP